MSELRILELSSFFKIPASASGDNGICDRFFGKLENLTIKNNFTIKKETKMWQGVSVKITFKEFFEDNSSPNVKSLELRKLLESIHIEYTFSGYIIYISRDAEQTIPYIDVTFS